jgi:hypothetical protein
MNREEFMKSVSYELNRIAEVLYEDPDVFNPNISISWCERGEEGASDSEYKKITMKFRPSMEHKSRCGPHLCACLDKESVGFVTRI